MKETNDQKFDFYNLQKIKYKLDENTPSDKFQLQNSRKNAKL